MVVSDFRPSIAQDSGNVIVLPDVLISSLDLQLKLRKLAAELPWIVMSPRFMAQFMARS